MNKSLNIIDNIKTRLIYSFFISNNIKSFDDHISYIMHLICLEYCLTTYSLFDECIFIIHTEDLNNPLIKELKNKLSIITINYKHIQFIIEKTDSYEREGKIFKKYIIDKFDEYDGLTLFFHNKGINDIYKNDIDNWCSYWVIGEYYHLMTFRKEYLGNFIRSKKLIYGWPYMCDNYHPQWLIGGSCYWMKCKDIQTYIKDHNLKTNYITSRSLAEYYFPEILNKKLIDYPYSNIIKDYTYHEYYEPSLNGKFNEYLQQITPYNEYVKFKEFYNEMINKYNNYINK